MLRRGPLAHECSVTAGRAHDYDNDPGKPACAWDDADGIDQLITALVNDALAVLNAVAGLGLDQAQSYAVGLLALVAGQDVEPEDEDGAWRIIPVTMPGRIVSTVDPEVPACAQELQRLPRRLQGPHRS